MCATRPCQLFSPVRSGTPALLLFSSKKHTSIFYCRQSERRRSSITDLITNLYQGKSVMPNNNADFCGTVISHVMMPYHANPAGNVNGGVIMQLIDDAAFVIATRFARANVVTASIDRIDFHRPVHVGDLLTLMGCLNMTHRSSMEIGVRVEGEDMQSGEVRHIASAYLTFVALDTNGSPIPIPAYAPMDKDGRRRNIEALKRREQRQEHLLR